jgi:hypothetical protein
MGVSRCELAREWSDIERLLQGPRLLAQEPPHGSPALRARAASRAGRDAERPPFVAVKTIVDSWVLSPRLNCEYGGRMD